MSKDSNSWGEIFAKFHQRHRELKPDGSTKALKFTAYFNRALGALIDSGLCMEARAIAWAIRYAWGNNSDWCVDKLNGEAIGQKEFAKRVGISKQRACDVWAQLEVEGLLVAGTGHKVYPSDNPPETAKSNQKGQKSGPHRTFIPYKEWCEKVWKVQALTDFQKLKSLEDQVSEIKIVRLGLYRQAKRAGTNRGPTSLNSLTGEETGGRAVPVLEKEAHAPTEPARPPASAPQIKRWLLEHIPVPTALDDIVLSQIAARIPDEETFLRFKVAALNVQEPRKWAVFIDVAKQACARGSTPAKQDRKERERREVEEIDRKVEEAIAQERAARERKKGAPV